MPLKQDYIAIFITAASLKQARKIAIVLVSKKLAACVNIVPAVDSIFRWKAKIERAKEVLLIAKTKASRFESLKRQVKKIHSYEVPEIIALPIIAGNKEYLKWIEESTV